MVWRGTWEDGKRMTIRLSEIEMMKFTPVAEATNADGTVRTDSSASWYMRLSSGKETMSLAEEIGNSIHEAWMHHLEHVSAVSARR